MFSIPTFATCSSAKVGWSMTTFLSELFAILVKTDMGTGPAAAIRDRIGTDFRGRVVHMDEVLGQREGRNSQDPASSRSSRSNCAASGPTVILIVGVNGSGKTTSIAKLANLFQVARQESGARRGRHVPRGGRRAAHDLGRSARASKSSREGRGATRRLSPIGRVRAAPSKRNAEICIIDTAGRLQTQANLMQQLEKIHRVIEQADSRSAARNAAGARCHRRPKRHQPGRKDFRRPPSAPASSWPSSTARPKAA